MAEIIKTLKPSGGDYSTLAAWNSAEATDLVAAGDTHVLECDINPSGYRIGNFTFDAGWNTGPNNYVTIRPAAGQEHDGTSGSGVVFYSQGFDVFRVGLPYLEIIGIEIDGRGTAAAQGFSLNADGPVLIDKCICSNFVDATRFAVNIQDHVFLVVRNSIFQGNAVNVTTGNFPPIYSDESDASKFINCTVVDIQSGGSAFNAGTGGGLSRGYFCINCLTDVGSEVAYSGDPLKIQTRYCSSSDATLNNTTEGAGNRDNQTFTFAGADDYHLDPSDAGAQGYGEDLSSYAYGAFDDDIDGDTRVAPWDIGADEIEGGEPPAGATQNAIFHGTDF